MSILDAQPSNMLACEMDGGLGSHGLSAKGTKDEVKRSEGLPTRSWDYFLHINHIELMNDILW